MILSVSPSKFLKSIKLTGYFFSITFFVFKRFQQVVGSTYCGPGPFDFIPFTSFHSQPVHSFVPALFVVLWLLALISRAVFVLLFRLSLVVIEVLGLKWDWGPFGDIVCIVLSTCTSTPLGDILWRVTAEPATTLDLWGAVTGNASLHLRGIRTLSLIDDILGPYRSEYLFQLSFCPHDFSLLFLLLCCLIDDEGTWVCVELVVCQRTCGVAVISHYLSLVDWENIIWSWMTSKN